MSLCTGFFPPVLAMGGIIYFLSLEKPSQPLTSVLWGLREMQRTIAASQVNHETGWGQTVHRDKRGVDGRRLCFYREMAKKGFWGEQPQLWALCSYLCIYSANFGQKWDPGGHLFWSPDWTQTPPPFSAGCPPWHLLPHGLSSLLKPAILHWGLETGDKHPEALLT